jgi:hypothetical protein
MRYFILSLLALTLLAASASAVNFTSTLSAEKDIVFPYEIAVFTLTVTNTQEVADYFTVFTPEYDWILDTEESLGELEPGETGRVHVQLIPKAEVQTGPQAVRVRVRSANTGDVQTFSKVVTVRSLNSSTKIWTPNVGLSAQVDEQVDPREGMTIAVYLRNRNPREYDNELDVRVEGGLFTKEYTTSLGGINGEESEKTNQISIPLDPLTPPGTHSLRISLSVNNTVINRYETTYAIIPYTAVTPATSSQTEFFKTTTVYSIENDGNTPQDGEVIHPTSFLKRLFTSASADYSVERTAAGTALVFTLPLQPNAKSEVTVTENYRLLVLLGLLVVLSVISYYMFRSPTVLRKEAIIYGGSTDGVSQIKIRLFIKNRSAKAIHNIHIIDKVTSMADVVKETSLGTLHPTKIIRKKGHGTLVRWDIDTLDAFEERIITYQVRTQLKLIGDVYLPAMKAKFDKNGRERTSYSNEVNIPREG